MKTIAAIDSPKGLGEIILLARKRQGLTQMELAEIADVSRSFVNHLEGNHPRAELGKVVEVLKALDISLAALIPETKHSTNTGQVVPRPDAPRLSHEYEAGAPRSTPDQAEYGAIAPSEYNRMRFSMARQNLARAQRAKRAKSLREITSAWDDGSVIPTPETRDIVNRYIDGLADIDEALAQAKNLANRQR